MFPRDKCYFKISNFPITGSRLALPLMPLIKPIIAKIKITTAKTGIKIHPSNGIIPKIILPTIAIMNSSTPWLA